MLLGCSFAREVWYHILQLLRLRRFTPDGTLLLADWWPNLSAATPAGHRKMMNTTITATLRFIWLERNSRVFNHNASLASAVVSLIRAELGLWSAARVDGGHPFQNHTSGIALRKVASDSCNDLCTNPILLNGKDMQCSACS